MASLTDCGVGVKVVFLLMVQEVLAQESTCYSAGSIAGSVVGTLLVTLALVALAYLMWRIYWRSRRGKHLVLVTDPEGAGDQYAFDNPCFKDGTPIGRTTMEKESTKLDQKARWSPWTALVGNRTADKRRAMDDSFVGEPQVNVVALRSHDFTGLGFNICGNMRDGIFVKDVLHRGPASESGRITPGDRIDSIRISFRHMVFEDALTILSYASPYDVQLEVENASNSCPSTLIRTKRTSGSSIAPADRICHPFYRSQSIADLAQIGKASLKRMQQMSGISKSPWPESQLDESGDYPTLKLSSTPTGNETRKENLKLEKTAAVSGIGIVKPERAKKVPTKGTSPPHTNIECQESSSQDESSGKDTLNRFQKFGVRVLPDSSTSNRNSHFVSGESAGSKQNAGDFPTEHESKKSAIEAEHKQNEQNSIIEKVGEGTTAVVSSSTSHSSVKNRVAIPSLEIDTAGGKPKPSSFYYDERGIDVGPVEPQRNHPKQSLMGSQPDEGKLIVEAPGESNVKNLLTKGLQNLKDKLHHHDKKRNGVQNTELSDNIEHDMQDLTEQPISLHTTEVVEMDAHRQSGKQREQSESNQESSMGLTSANSYEGEIPTEIPEEVCRAAMAARSNRKSLGNVTVEPQVQERRRTISQDDPCEGSSSESEDTTVSGGMESDSLGRMHKRPNKRKAPLPPPEEGEDNKFTPTGLISYLGTERNLELGNLSSTSEKQRLKNSTVQHSNKKQNNPNEDTENNIQVADDVVAMPIMEKNITSFADLARQHNNPDVMQKEITNITIEGISNKPLRADITTFGTSVAGIQSTNMSLERDDSAVQDFKPPQQHLDYDIGVNVSSINSDSDSDLERLEGDDDSYDDVVKGRKIKKGGTTIELNSSHITIHHSPSSDTVQLDNESTRKAASLGDLSRLDSEQPMSILERAVSLDLADGGTPHGSKKRKAPLPPPGEDYLGSMPDGDEGVAHRKEPRLETAMDTFQRRRLKKSSDWGTLEEALLQSDGKATDLQMIKGNDPSAEDIPHLQSTITVLEANSIEHLPKSDSNKGIDTSNLSSTFTNSHLGITRTDILNVDDVGYSTILGCVSSGANSMEQIETESPQHQQKTVLRITPEPAAEPNFSSTSSQVNIASGTLTAALTHDSSFASGEVRNITANQADAAQTFNTKLSGFYNLAQSNLIAPSSPQHSNNNPIVGLVSSTPISHSGEVYNNATKHNGGETLRSPIVTSSHQHSGISSIHVSSSTTHDGSDADSNILASSVTDPFITAVDSTATALIGEISKNDDGEDTAWEQDSQPPELPTTPVPVLSQLSSFKPSPSMTYITEIQVVTTADGSNNDLITESTIEEQQTSPSAEVSSSVVTQRALKNKSDSSLSSDSITSEGDDKETDTVHSITTPGSVIPKKNVTVTAIRNTVSRIPMRITTDRVQPTLPSVHVPSNSVNHNTNMEERRVKPVRPPVPPRKTDSSTTSTITMEGSGRVHNRIQPLPMENIHIGPPAGSSSGKFISFSSLTPQVTASAENGASRNSTSFEQWVFLDEGSTHNGLEGSPTADESTSAPHSMVVSLPARTQSVTHIVLDTKQSNGNHGNP